MPINNNLKQVNRPMVDKFGEPAKVEFENNIDALKVSIVTGPTMEELRKYVPIFAYSTWADKPTDTTMTDDEADKCFYQCLNGKVIPTLLETIKVTFLLDGICHQDVTHLIRYRNASFAAECSADKFWNDRIAVVPNSIQQSDELYERYQKVIKDCLDLYVDMAATKQIPILDARYILPRGLGTWYLASFSLKDAIHFINQRMDKQIQPETDNFMAYGMLLALCERYPLISKLIDIHKPAYFYAKMARTNLSSNYYFPDKDTDIYEYNEKDYMYQCTRDKLNGTNENATNHFNDKIAEVDKKLEEYRNYCDIKYPDMKTW